MVLHRLSPFLVLPLLLGPAVGCAKAVPYSPPFAHPETIVRVTEGSDSSEFVVAGNFTTDERGRPGDFGAVAELKKGAVRVRYQYVGTAMCPLSDDGRDWGEADVYVFSITGHGALTEIIPVVYTGEPKTVIERSGLKVTMEEGKGDAPVTAAAD